MASVTDSRADIGSQFCKISVILQKTGNYQFGSQFREGFKGPPFVAAESVSCKSNLGAREIKKERSDYLMTWSE